MLGTGAAYAGPGQASSGYLVKEGTTSLLLDCGNGVVSRLQEAGELEGLTALLFTHLHADHLLDVFPLFYSRVYGGKQYPPLPVFLPPGESDRFARIAEVLRVEPRKLFEGAFHTSEFDAAGMTLDGLKLAFNRNRHPVPTYSVRIEKYPISVVYTADTGPYDELADFARNCSLLLSEASLSEQDYDPEHPLHLTPRLAATVAKKARVRRLLLTHLWPHYDRQTMLTQAQKVFPATELAEELQRYVIARIGPPGQRLG